MIYIPSIIVDRTDFDMQHDGAMYRSSVSEGGRLICDLSAFPPTHVPLLPSSEGKIKFVISTATDDELAMIAMTWLDPTHILR